MRQLFHDSPFFARLTFALALVFSATFAHSQVPVGMAPPLHFQFLTANGAPLANGKIFTYSAGTSTPLNTYVDGTGTTQNTNPIVLDATGSPSNGTVETSIFLANNAYKFVAYNSQNVQQWSVDNVSTYFGLLNSNNVWTGTNTFDNAITILATDQQIVLGVPGNQTTVDFPPPTGNVTLEFPNISDTVVARTTTDTLTNKTLTSPVINSPTINSIAMANGVPTGITLFNSTTGTTLNTLTEMVNTGGNVAAQIVPIAAVGGSLGVTTAGAGATGIATIIQSGSVSCVFDNATVGGDYVQISPTVAGNCHDVGAVYPASGQVVGRAEQTMGSAGTWLLDLFPPEIRQGAICADGTATSVNGNTTAQQVIKTPCPFAPGALNAVGRTFRLTTQGDLFPSTTAAIAFSIGIGNTTSLSSVGGLVQQSGSADIFNFQSEVVCVVRTPGASGVFWCSPITTLSGLGSPTITAQGFTMTGIDLTATVYVGDLCIFASASASNVCTENLQLVEQLN